MAEPHGSGKQSAEASKDDSEKANKPTGSKDFWDKFSTLSAFLSTLLVAIVGGTFTYIFNQREAAHQRNIQETQTVAQLMPFLTSKDQGTKKAAFIAVKVLQDTQLMVNLAASDPSAPGARDALREVVSTSANASDRKLAADLLGRYEMVPLCTLPFDPIRQHHAIDDSCGAYGDITSPVAAQSQNKAKNNFCAPGPPVNIDLALMRTLQQAVDDKGINFTKGGEPVDRDTFRSFSTVGRNIGEGTMVRIAAYIVEAHHVNLGIGESVNCNGATQEDNDIRISLVEKTSDQECTSITAKISPHFRPGSWNEIGYFENYDSRRKVYMVDPGLSERFRSHKYRFTGQLFFDASHTPCPCGSNCSPVRASSWEVHPVYGIEICKDATNSKCAVDDDADWEPIEHPPSEK